MNAQKISETDEVFWDTNADGEPVLRFRRNVWISFEAAYPQPKSEGVKGILEWGDKRKKRNKK